MLLFTYSGLQVYFAEAVNIQHSVFATGVENLEARSRFI
jgi:hypothetical protein